MCIHFFEGYFFSIFSGNEVQGTNADTTSRCTREQLEEYTRLFVTFNKRTEEEKGKITGKQSWNILFQDSVNLRKQFWFLFLYFPLISFFFFNPKEVGQCLSKLTADIFGIKTNKKAEEKYSQNQTTPNVLHIVLRHSALMTLDLWPKPYHENSPM